MSFSQLTFGQDMCKAGNPLVEFVESEKEQNA